MTSSLGNGAYALAPGFEGASITPEQAEAFAAGFLPSWEADGGVVAVATATNGHAAGDLRATMKSNGVHAETHAPPSRTHINEPEDSVVIDRSITADQLAPTPPDSARVPVAAVRLAPAMAPAVAAPVAPVAAVPFPQPASLRPMPPPASVRPMPPQRPARAVARAVPIDEDVPAPKSKKGLFIGLGIGAAAVLAVVIGIATSGGEASKADSSGGPTITVVKPEDSAKNPAAPPAPTETATAKPTTPVAANTTPPTPVTALPVAPTQDPPRAKPAHAAAAQPTYNVPPRAAQPRSGGGTAIVKDVPF